MALCNALDGLPLALEIAASRIRAFTPKEMLSQLEDRFRLLARPSRGTQKDQRHRSILATLEWSWRLLTPAQQHFLSALSVFRGGWTAEMAAEVCDVPDAEERLEALAMDSLVIGEESTTLTTRFRLLDMVRAFEKASGRPVPYEIAPRREGDIASCYADPGTAQALLCWSAQSGLDAMCEDAWRWQRNNPNGYAATKK